jgi:hypothetical protein
MGKKLKITEEQLKRLVSSKQRLQERWGSYSETTLDGWEEETENAVKKLSKVTVEHLNNMSEKQKSKMHFEMGHYDDNVYDFIMDQIGNVDAGEIVSFAKSNEEEIGTEAQFVIFAIDDFCSVLGINDDDEDENEEEEGTPPSEEEMTPPSEEETMNNQVYESIRNNFKRFL